MIRFQIFYTLKLSTDEFEEEDESRKSFLLLS